MRKLYYSLSVLLVISIFGCATRNDDKDNTENKFDQNYQTPKISLQDYKSPELRSSAQNNNLSVAIAISGGGHRAGNFGIGVLKELENIKCRNTSYNALKEIDYFSTVSGGGIAAGVYLSTLYDHIKSNNSSIGYSLSSIIDNNKNNITRNLKRGYHGILEQALINIKSFGNNDRGDFLEEEFDKKLLGAETRKDGRSLVLGDIFIPYNKNNNPLLPFWMANATVYENGSIFPFHPKALEKYSISRYTHYLEPNEINGDYFSLPLSIGLKASASFPGVVPATTLASNFDPNNGYLQLFDGGLADNLGVITAFDMLSETGNNDKVLIIVDAYNGQTEPFSSQEGSPVILQILARSTVISLDAWRIRHKANIEHLSSSNIFNGKPVKIIYLSFDDLDKLSKEKVYGIGTNFDITKQQQNNLLTAAKQIVNTKKKDIVYNIFNKECA